MSRFCLILCRVGCTHGDALTLLPTSHTLVTASQSSLGGTQFGARASMLSPLTAVSPACGKIRRVQDEALRPLHVYKNAWQSIPGISPWVLNIIENGYSLQFRHRPPRFNGVVSSVVSPQNIPVLRQEIDSLLAKRAIEVVSPSEIESGFYSCYFVVPKRDGGFRPILDLRPINRALYKCAFKMLTIKQILAQIRPGTGLFQWI